MKRTNRQRGFTLIELMLAMVFLGSILIITTLLLTQTLSIYNKGLTTKQINQVGRTMVEELIRTSNSGSSIGYGIQCLSLDRSVYIWNVADPSPTATNEYLPALPAPHTLYTYSDGKPVNFIKLFDVPDGCTGVNTSAIDRSKASPLIADNIHVYSIATNAVSTNLVQFSMVLGTYAGIGSSYNLFPEDGSLICRSDGLGGYCSKGSIETVLYLPNGIN